jgi:uncharacterized Fe-S cluster protein YjdI
MMETHKYSNGEITILWKPKLCIHSGICVKTLPKVYNPQERPWIKPENAATEELRNQVAQCPSGALSILEPQKEVDMTFEKYENAPTLSVTMAKLKAEGYTEDFNLDAECIHCQNGLFKLYPSDFKIDKYFRFEGESDPGDASILYAISSKKHGLKGVLVNGYGIYSEPLTNEMLEKLNTN